MKSPFKILFLFAILAIVSCSKKEDPIKEQTAALSIVLKSDAGSEELQVVGVNTTVVFTVEGNDGENYTDVSKLYVNDEEITGSTYEFTTTGQYSVKAKYNDISTNTLNFEVLEPTQRVLTISVPKAFRNQTIVFGLRDDQGNDTAADATFYVNNEEISGNTFSSPSVGDFEVYAVYEANDETFTTEAKEFEVFIPKRKVVVEDYTGTWCGFCPGVAVAIEDLRDVTEHVAVVAIHKATSTVPDPLDYPRVGELQAMFDVDNGFPKARINRTVDWPRPYVLSQATAIAGTDTDVSIAVNSQLNGSSLSVNVKVAYENGSTQGDKVVVYLLENGIVSPQANYFNETPGHPYEGLGNPIPNYVHNDGLRYSLSDLFGDAIPNLPAFQVHSKDYTFEVPSHYVGENLSFVVMVVNADNSAKNAQFSKINEFKNYE
jgi:thiol-disulfide isomerase/thioredoxin